MSWQRKVVSFFLSLGLWLAGSALTLLCLPSDDFFAGMLFLIGLAGVGMGILIHALVDGLLHGVDCSCKIKAA